VDVFLKRDSQTDFILLASPPAVIFSLNANGTFSMYGFCFLDVSCFLGSFSVRMRSFKLILGHPLRALLV